MTNPKFAIHENVKVTGDFQHGLNGVVTQHLGPSVTGKQRYEVYFGGNNTADYSEDELTSRDHPEL